MQLEDLQLYVAELSEEERSALGEEGLFLHRKPKHGGYESSPRGFVAFASTGGDGVHFNLPESPGAKGPVIMTVPMAFESPNIVVGESLFEFLCLGCAHGYFGLEQLAYKFKGTAERLQKPVSGSQALLKLSERFCLQPWSNVYERLSELRGT